MLRLKHRAQHSGIDEILPEAFAMVNAAISRILGVQATGEQLLAGLHMLQGRIVEMNAGEGKTIAAAFPAVVHALRGSSVHVITANDYLAARDADLLAPVYRSLGISAGAVLGYMDDGERKLAYRKGIVYSTMRELGFDFLRDNLKFTSEAQVQGKLEVAIIDEIDHALIDEAFTPMIISGSPVGNNRAVARVKNVVAEMIGLQREVTQALPGKLSQPGLDSRTEARLLAQLLLAEPEDPKLKEYLAENPSWFKRLRTVADQDFPDLTPELFYAIDPDHRFVTLTEKGRDFLELRLGPFHDGRSMEEAVESIWARQDWTLAQRRKKSDGISRRLARQYNLGSQVYQMLRAFLLLHRDVDYFDTEDSIVLIDRSTGRPRADCIYQQGLHAALEAKEGVTSHLDCETLGQISVEGFIRRYQSISGMTGTALSSSDEFLQKYGLPVAVLPPARPLNRVDLGYKVYLTRREKLSAILDQVIACHRVGQPVLVGTPTVERSEELSRLLSERGIGHNLLNALSCHLEAQTVKDAGNLGAVTVATNMAGRGTDILLQPGLNAGIAGRYVQLIGQHLSNDAGSVLIDCHSPVEADILEGELTKVGLFSTAQRGLGGCHQLQVTLIGNGNPDNGPLILDFALGLHVIGTEIHDTPRIDLQLNGRSGRQGDFGVTQTILSLEDNLINLHVDGVLKPGGCRKVDAAGRVYLAGPAVEEHVRGVQELAEREGEARRGLIQDYAAVLDLQTSMFYRWRRRAMAATSLKGLCDDSARESAARLVACHFPQVTLERYAGQFDCLVDEVRLDHRVDCSGLFGGDFNLLPQELGWLFIGKLERLEDRLGRKEFSDLARLVFLQTCDDLWRSHINELQGLISNQVFGAASHKSAVAHYIRQCFQAWGGFRERVVAEFLSRLLTLPLPRTDTQPPPTIQINNDVRMLIADLPTAVAAAGD
jgi:preprotein translocase subunit SecA